MAEIVLRMLIVQKFVILLITARMILILARQMETGTVLAMNAIRHRNPVPRILTMTAFLQAHAILLINMLNALQQKRLVSLLLTALRVSAV
jgi:hypothetical protein